MYACLSPIFLSFWKWSFLCVWEIMSVQLSWQQEVRERTNRVGSGKLLLALTSTAYLGLGSRRDPLPYFCSFPEELISYFPFTSYRVLIQHGPHIWERTQKSLSNYILYIILCTRNNDINYILVRYSLTNSGLPRNIRFLTNQLTLWSWVLLEKPPVAQLLKNFPTSYRTRRFVTLSTRSLHWPLSWAR
jgi:hypothetical protein